MKIQPFQLERYLAEHEFSAPHLLCCSDCESLSVQELLKLEPGAEEQLLRLWLGYTPSWGNPSLRSEIAKLYHQIEEKHILVHSGAEEAIFTFMNTVLDHGDHLIVHYPAYQSLVQIAESIGCEVTRWVTQEEKGWEVDLEFLRKHLRHNTKAVVVNCPHNPTGYVMPRDVFTSLVELSQEHGFIVFSDEVYRFLEHETDERLPALSDVDARGVSLGVMSKSFGLAGLRIGWIATRNLPLLEQLTTFKDYTTICNSAPSEFLAEVALRHRDTILRRNLGIVRKNLDVLGQFFTEFQGLFNWHPPKAGAIAFPSLTDGGDSRRFCNDLLRQSGVLLLPGTLYGPEYISNFRIGYGRVNLPDCIEKLRAYIDNLR